MERGHEAAPAVRVSPRWIRCNLPRWPALKSKHCGEGWATRAPTKCNENRWHGRPLRNAPGTADHKGWLQEADTSKWPPAREAAGGKAQEHDVDHAYLASTSEPTKQPTCGNMSASRGLADAANSIRRVLSLASGAPDMGHIPVCDTRAIEAPNCLPCDHGGTSTIPARKRCQHEAAARNCKSKPYT